MVSADGTITIIRAGRSEREIIHELLKADAEERHANERNAIQGFEDALTHFDFLDSDSFWILIALFQEKPVGYLSAVRIPKGDSRKSFIFVDELWVLSAYRRNGVATALVNAMSELGKEIEAYGIRLITEMDNKAGKAFYQNVGFAVQEYAFCQKKL